MKRYYLLVLLISAYVISSAQSRKEKEITAVVESLRKAIVDANASALKELLSDQVSYGHSNANIESKEELIQKLSTGEYDFVTMDLSAQTIKIFGNTAIVRNKLDAKTADKGKPGEAHLLTLMVWQKTKGRWMLIARQAVKVILPV
ncbi:MAG: nuclear transport factor 2 family protein [Flavitalea sp.]